MELLLDRVERREVSAMAFPTPLQTEAFFVQFFERFDESDAPRLLEGVKIVAQQLEAVLQRHHCMPIAALHQPFDPNVHEAILHQPSADAAPNTVLAEVQQGFQLHDRVVRPSQVIVAAPAQDSQPST